jgi:molecular chaperone Hsp33
VNALEGAPRPAEPCRFDARPLLASPHDERAGLLSILRASAASETPHRAAFPFAGADLGAALTFFLRNDREQGGEMALEALVSARQPLEAVAGVLVTAVDAADAEKARVLGKPLRQGALAAALRQTGDAAALGETVAQQFRLGRLRPVASLTPRFACRCSRDRVMRALRSLGGPELGDMAARDGGADLTCDFCNAAYSFSAAELLQIAQP